MTPADAVLEDALREAGYAHVTPWHLCCVEAYLAQVKTLRTVSWQDRYDLLSERLGYDLNNDIMQLHAMALRDAEVQRAQAEFARAILREAGL